VDPRHFTATVQREEHGGHFVELPFDPVDAFGRARAPVLATIAGVEYPTRVAIYGGRAYIGVRREIRARAGIEPGDVVEVTVARDPAR
jgi:hypothetical protein